MVSLSRLVGLGRSVSLIALVACALGCSGSELETRLRASHVPTHPTADTLSEPAEYADRPISVEAGEFYFAEAGVGDPYGAGIPYPMFRAMMRRFPELLGKDWREFNAKFGTIPNPTAPGDPLALPVGFHLTIDPITKVHFLMLNCAVCHSAEVVTDQGRQIVSGLGNKRIKIHAYDRALTEISEHADFSVDHLHLTSAQLARKERLVWPGLNQRVILRNAIGAFKRRAQARGRHVRRIGDGLPGKVATIEGFIMALNHQRGASLELPAAIGWVKIPDVAVWRYRETNSYDAAAIGSPTALVAEADFAFGVRSEWYETHRHIPTSIYLYLKQFRRDLPFPRDVNLRLAHAGKVAFDANCSHCHGSYSAPDAVEKTVSYREQVIPQKVVGTDPVRLNAVTEEFLRFANAEASTRGLTAVQMSGGYVPRPMVDVWLRGLYGHVGQWPDLATLCLAPEQRPRQFVIDPSAPVNLERVGLRWFPVVIDNGVPMVEREGKRVPVKLEGDQYLYDAEQPGFDVRGHEYLSRLATANQRAILEYLKTL